MNARIAFVTLSFFFFSFLLSAQTFISLDWNHPAPMYEEDDIIQTDIPGFAGAYYSEENQLPQYSTQIKLGKDYSLYDYNVKIKYPEFGDLTKKQIQAIKEKKIELPVYPQPETYLTISSKEGILNINFVPLVDKDGIYQRINSFKLVLEKIDKPRKVGTRSSERKYTTNSVLSSGKWVKIQILSSGVYKMTHDKLKEMGFKDPSKVRLYGYGGLILSELADAERIDDLNEVPLWREDNYVLFYGNGTIRWEYDSNSKDYVHKQNHYSTHGYYFLTEMDEPPMAFPKLSSLSENGAITTTTFPDYFLEEKEEYSWAGLGRKLYEAYDYKNGNPKTYEFEMQGITSDPASITVAFTGGVSSGSSLSVNLNDKEIGTVSLNHSKGYPSYDQFLEGVNTFSWMPEGKEKHRLTLKHIRTTNISGHLDFIRFNYTRKLQLYNYFTCFRVKESGKYKFIIENSNENTVVWDISKANAYVEIPGILSGSFYTVVAENDLNNEWIVLNTKGDFPTVEIVGEIENQNLHAMYDIDMMIISPPNIGLIRQAERLAEAHRKIDGMKVEVITSTQIYNEFSSGTPDATAYRWFMKMFYDRAESVENRPKYLLLFGNATSDNRMLSSAWRQYNPEDFLLCYPSEDSQNKVFSYVLEDYFGLLDNEEGVDVAKEKTDLGIGRFLISTESEAKEVVDKVITYMENKEPGPWKNVVALLADDDKGSGDPYVYMDTANNLANTLEKNNPDILIKKIYWDAHKVVRTSTGKTYPTITKQLLELFNEGMLVMNYTGHAGPIGFSDELCLTISDISSINSSRPPVWITAGCDVTPFDLPEESIGKKAFLHPKGAAIALYTTTRTTRSIDNDPINQKIMEYLFNGEHLTLGEVFRLAKSDITKSNTQFFVLIGDPALKLSLPEYGIVIDNFNKVDAEGNPSTIQAGGIVSVEGSVVNKNGEVLNDFNGIIHPTVLDSKYKVTTYNNSDWKKAFTYYDQNKILFKGSDSIRAGKFKFEFPIPLDINYSFESGMLNLYAVDENSEREGSGAYINFLIGGTDPSALITDSLGPKINLYLNTPDFVDGGKVNETPYLVVELEDEDGINTTGNGIGHDLLAVIDNSSVYSYVLNNYYQSVLGSYKKGIIRYSLPELTEGKHELLFRAWDVKNNSSTATLRFEVVKGLRPQLFDVECTNSPARDHTTFILTHDRPDSEVDVRLSVFDLSGNELWSYETKEISSDNYYYVDWDLTTSGGAKLSPGLYLFRAVLSSPHGDKESTRSKKIVVLE